ELEDALAELVARGRLHCDSFAGLRALLVPASKRPSAVSRRGRRVALFGIQDAGRWTLTRHPDIERATGNDPQAVEHVARTLLQRYGVVCWRLLEREAGWLPSWRELLRVYHRLEARGEIRGGRFIAGISGEQLALPEAIGALRPVRKRVPGDESISLSALDPLNLVGSLLPGTRVARQLGGRVLWRDGVPLATLVAGKAELLVVRSSEEQRDIRRALLREPDSAGLIAMPPVEAAMHQRRGAVDRDANG